MMPVVRAGFEFRPRSGWRVVVSGDSLLPGKLPQDQLARLLGQFGPLPAEIRVGPEIGEDAAVIDIPGGVLVAVTDPVTLTSADVGNSR